MVNTDEQLEDPNDPYAAVKSHSVASHESGKAKVSNVDITLKGPNFLAGNFDSGHKNALDIPGKMAEHSKGNITKMSSLARDHEGRSGQPATNLNTEIGAGRREDN